MLHCSHHTVLACRRGRGRARVHGTGTNLKVGRHRSGAKVEGGTHPEFFFVVPLHFFGSQKYNWSFWWVLSWWSVQFGQLLVCCSSTHGAPCAQPFVKVGATCPRALWSRRHWRGTGPEVCLTTTFVLTSSTVYHYTSLPHHLYRLSDK